MATITTSICDNCRKPLPPDRDHWKLSYEDNQAGWASDKFSHSADSCSDFCAVILLLKWCKIDTDKIHDITSILNEKRYP